jgi:hypothetical protein
VKIRNDIRSINLFFVIPSLGSQEQNSKETPRPVLDQVISKCCPQPLYDSFEAQLPYNLSYKTTPANKNRSQHIVVMPRLL